MTVTQDEAQRFRSRELLHRLIGMGFRLDFEPRTPAGYAAEMVRVLREIGASRARLMAGSDTILSAGAAARRDSASGQIGLFGDAAAPPALTLPEATPWTPMQVIENEADALGWPVTEHPLYHPLRRAMELLRPPGS